MNPVQIYKKKNQSQIFYFAVFLYNTIKNIYKSILIVSDINQCEITILFWIHVKSKVEVIKANAVYFVVKHWIKNPNPNLNKKRKFTSKSFNIELANNCLVWSCDARVNDLTLLDASKKKNIKTEIIGLHLEKERILGFYLRKYLRANVWKLEEK